MKKFKLHYWLSNNGDGSASMKLAKNAKEAEKADEEQSEGWGENSAGHKTIILKDGKLYFEHTDYDAPYDKKKGYPKILIPLEEVDVKG